MIRTLRTFTLLLGILAASASRASAATWVVNGSGAGNFLEIAPAIAFAQPGDVIIVLPGTYASFVVDKGVTIIGFGQVNLFFSHIIVTNIPANQHAAIANIPMFWLSVTNCPGTVILQDSPSSAPISRLDIAQSADVRMSHIAVHGIGTPPNLDAPMIVDHSRVELVRCTIEGSDGADNPVGSGALGLACIGGSRIHVALTDLIGGHGGSPSAGQAGNGSAALDLSPGDEAILAGGGSASLIGGNGGISQSSSPPMPCSYNGLPGPAVSLFAGALVQYSGVMLLPGTGIEPGTCFSIQAPAISGPGMHIAASPADPTLEFVGSPIAGTAVQFVLRAPRGSQARIVFGRHPILVPDPATTIEHLAPVARVVNLGVVGASGQGQFGWSIPSSMLPGTFLVAQGEVTLPGGAILRTNSLPILVR